MLSLMALQSTRLDWVNLQAKCNDGSPAAFFYAPPQNGVWHIHLEGGGSCYDEDTCLSVTHEKSLMSSNFLPQSIWLGGIFSRDSTSPALAHAGHAFLKYCSSDSWLGNSSKIWRGRPFFFHGAVILAEAVYALLDRGMKHAEMVLFSGCSAGGRGAIYNLDGLCSLVSSFSPNVRCLGLGDSAWWMESVFLRGGLELQSLLRKNAAHGREVWGGSWLSQPLWRCRQAQQHLPKVSTGALAKFSPNISHFDRCMFGPTLAEHLQTATLLSISLNDFFQFDHLAPSYHSVYFGGENGGPLSQIDLQAIAALRSEFQQSLANWVSTKEPLRLVFASGCFGHCITEGPLYNTIRLREGPGKGLALSDAVAAFLEGHYLQSQAFVEQCHCETLSCSDGCEPRGLWKVVLTMSCRYVLLPLCFLCGISWLRRRKGVPVESERL